jgi:NarL family two-component system response regulator YdfI
VIVAASAVVRAGLASILTARPGLEVAGTLAHVDNLADQIDSLAADVVLVDLDREALPSNPLLPSLEPGSDGPAFVLLLRAPDDGAVVDALRHGARVVLAREAQPEEIAAAVDAAAAGLLAVPAARAAAVLPLLVSPARPSTSSTMESLTPREIEVLAMLAEGSGNKQIARRLGISEHTVKFHVGSILAKLGAASRTEAVTLGLRRGLIMV